jgi:transcription antitermination factor NusG
VKFEASRDEFVHLPALLQMGVPSALEKAVAMTNCGKRSTGSYSLQVSVDRASSLAEAGGPQWFAVAVKPRFDKAVARTLESKGFETLLPLYKTQHRYAARSKVSELPLFPGYVFCRFNVLTRLPILTTPGVTQILGTGNTPTALSEEEILSLRAAIQAGFPLHPFPFVQAGERVRIDQGALRGVVGLVVKIKGSLRVILSVTLLQRSVLLEIGRHQVSSESARRPAFDDGRYDSVATLPFSSSCAD